MAHQSPELLRLMDNARVHLPGALDSALKLELFNVLDEFCQRSKYWQEEIEITTTADQTEYQIAGVEDGQIIDLLYVVNENGSTVAASMPLLGTVVLRTEPEGGVVLTIGVAYTAVDPVSTDDYPVIPDELLHKYGKGILHGLVGAMMTHPAKPYSNQQLAVFHTRKFAGAVAQARADVRHKNLYDGQTWRFPGFAAGSQRN